MQVPKTPQTSPLTLPPAVCPGAPVKNNNNNDYVPIGNSVRRCLFLKDECPGAPVKKKPDYRLINGSLEPCVLFKENNDGYETPDDQPTIPYNAPPARKKR
jgi:hypothetical protein